MKDAEPLMCEVPGCENEWEADGMCADHWQEFFEWRRSRK